MGLIASHAGLREAPGAPITEAVVADVAARLAEHLRRAGLPEAVAVAHDAEPRAADLTAAAIRGASGAGADVVDLGTALTPVARLAARRRGLGGALVVTGSHLGPKLTGIKLAVAPDLIPLDPRELPPDAARAPRTGRVTRSDGSAEEHADAVAAAVDAEAIRAAGLTVRGPDVAGPLLERLGCTAGSGDADVGLEPDADGDRLRLDAGTLALDPEDTLPLVALARRPRTLVRSTETSRATELMLGEGTRVIAVPPGELHLVRALADAGAEALAGEGNGGVVVQEVGLARDGLATAAQVLELIARTGEPLEELARRIPVMQRRRLTIDADRGDAALAAGAAVPDARRGRDGEVAIERGDGLWALVRRSATEPVVKVVVEGRDAAAVDALVEELAEREPSIAP